MPERAGAPWWLVAVVGATAAFVAGFVVWLYTPSNVQPMSTAAPVTVTQTVAVTSTVTATPSGPPPPPPSASGAPGAGTQWVVRTPAGMSCLLDDKEVTCTGEFDSGAEGYRWRPGGSSPEKLTSPVSLPGSGVALTYGSRRSAGPWTISMEKSGVTFQHGSSGPSVTFNKSGATVG
ncbi:hypothetical protein ACT17_06220 [Mycolicibacterium conceptionense]|uniref:Uncharacterized protein n=1 Tax=Mycolicibacterium conceptionense TaxID=451644 RepID=A0A0J8X2F2_9MYCO|nr:hypothetical protein [Mycolicibacterium conceptionense]KMV19634.1 hypothetical protein ACT17_06220 [Mycolicibacterium conceptionense]